ncbi:MAG TPA: hypothetical protein QF753_20535 [Victivallales bacterium]|nr:hypothetical protein [Victivallales bacterium]
MALRRFTSIKRNREVDVITDSKNVVGRIQRTINTDWEKFARDTVI